jgi:hypothetical protein
MFWQPRHLSDEELLLAADDELPHRRLSRARRHLADCSACRTRMLEIERTLAEVARLYRDRSNPPLPPAGPSRARLQSQMAEISTQLDRSLVSRFLLRAHEGRWTYAFGLLLLATVLVGLSYARRESSAMRALTSQPDVFLLPKNELTPGAARAVTVDEICRPGRGTVTQRVPAAVHRAVFESYRADYRRAADYELDYLITPELGGIADARNLWPQPFSRTEWNAHVKDELERLFHRLVCEQQIDLTTAQREMAGDWISAYKRYFKTSKPLRDYAQSPLTALDADHLIGELEELGLAAPPDSEGPVLMVLLQAGRQESLRRLSAEVGERSPSHPTVRAISAPSWQLYAPEGQRASIWRSSSR